MLSSPTALTHLTPLSLYHYPIPLSPTTLTHHPHLPSPHPPPSSTTTLAHLTSPYPPSSTTLVVPFLINCCSPELIGVRKYGVHINGYFYTEDGSLVMWIGKRSILKPKYPGLLDNIVCVILISCICVCTVCMCIVCAVCAVCMYCVSHVHVVHASTCIFVLCWVMHIPCTQESTVILKVAFYMWMNHTGLEC